MTIFRFAMVYELNTKTLGIPDGIRVDQKNNLWVSCADGVQIFNSSGKRVGKLDVGKVVQNICFGGKDMNTLFIAARNEIWSFGPFSSIGKS